MTLYFQISAIVFAMIALAEFWSKQAENRKFGYLAAASFAVFILLFLVLANIGTIIYGTE